MNSLRREVFVGNLSFFCKEQHLLDLFAQYAHVASAHIARNADKSKSLMYGFVTLETEQDALEIETLFDNHLFMGRRMRVRCRQRAPLAKDCLACDYQVHVALSSSFHATAIATLPDECFLRKKFMRFGHIVDLKVRDYTVHQGEDRQTGYAFLCFADPSAAFAVVNACLEGALRFDGVLCACTFAHQGRRFNEHSSFYALRTIFSK